MGNVFQQQWRQHERKNVLDGHAQLSHNKMKCLNQLTNTNCWITTRNCVWSWFTASVRLKLWWHHWNITKLQQVGSMNAHTGTERTIYASLSGSIKSIWGWSSFLNRIITIYEMWYHHHKLKSKWQYMKWQHMNSPSKKKMQPQWVKRWALSFRTGN